MDEHFDAASVAIFRDGEVLLIKRAVAPYLGYWTLPGGRIEAHETAEKAVWREIVEELGLTITPRFAARHEVMLDGGGTFKLAVFASDFEGGQIRASDEIAEWRFVAAGEIAALRTTPELARIVADASRVITGV